METTLLPVGSVVLLNGGQKKLMIYGLLQVRNEDGKAYDYIGCYYPEGYLNQEHAYLFNAEDIETVCYIGYIDSDYQMFDQKLREVIAERNGAAAESEAETEE